MGEIFPVAVDWQWGYLSSENPIDLPRLGMENLQISGSADLFSLITPLLLRKIP